MPTFIDDTDLTAERIMALRNSLFYVNGHFVTDRPEEYDGERRRARTPTKERKLRHRELSVMHAIKRLNRKLRALHKELLKIRADIIRDSNQH